MKKVTLFILIWYLSFNISVKAQEDSLFMDVGGVEELVKPENRNKTEVVSASRTAKKIENLPVTIYVVTREEILLNGYTTLVDVLKSVPGIKVSQPGSGELGEQFSMREFHGNNYTKILVDGITVKPSVTIGMPIEAQLPIRQAERIEIIIGPASAVYGADAAAGVINIITKKPKTGVFAQADINLGEYGYSYVNFTAGGKAGKNDRILKYSFYGSKSSIDNLNIFNDSAVYNPMNYLENTGMIFTAPDGTEYLPTELTEDILANYGLTKEMFLQTNYEGSLTTPKIRNIPGESQIVGFELKYKGFGLSYQNMMRKTHSSIGRTSFLYKYNDPQNYIGDKINRVTFSYDKKFKNIISTTNLSFLNYEQDNYSNFGVTFVEYTDKLYQYSASNDIFGEQLITYSNNNLELVSGISAQLSSDLPYTDYSLEPFDRNDYQIFMQENPIEALNHRFGFNPINFQNFSSFIQGYYIWGKFYLMAGIRHDYNTLYNDKNWNPRFAVLFKITEKSSVRISYGTAFKAPAPNLAYNSLSFLAGENLDSIYYAVVPNPNLLPEKFKAYELGIRKSFGANIHADINLFQNDIYNLIVNSYVNPDSLGFPLAVNKDNEPSRTYTNSPVAETILYGAELYLTFKNIIKPAKVSIEIGLAVSQMNQILPENISLETLKYLPLHTGKVKISTQPGKRFFFNALTYWSSKTATQNQLIYPEIEGFFDLDIITGLKLNKNITVFAKILNVFNEQYAGINATGYDIDLNYNPQPGRNIRFGMTFDMN